MRALMLATMLVLAMPGAQAPGVVAESKAQGQWGVAAFQTRLEGQRRYTLQIDGPDGIPFTARYLQVYVSRHPANRGSGNDDGTFSGTVPYQIDVVAPVSDVVFWRYSIVVSPDEPAELTVRLVDSGAR